MARAINLDEQINHFLSVLSDNKKKAVLTVVKTLAEGEEEDFWDELPDEIKTSVMIGLKESKAGRGKPHSLVMKRYKQWLKK